MEEKRIAQLLAPILDIEPLIHHKYISTFSVHRDLGCYLFSVLFLQPLCCLLFPLQILITHYIQVFYFSRSVLPFLGDKLLHTVVCNFAWPDLLPCEKYSLHFLLLVSLIINCISIILV